MVAGYVAFPKEWCPKFIQNSSILVIKLGALGDMVQALPMFKTLHQQFGDNLTLLTTAPFVDFANRTGYFKTIVCDDRTSLRANIKTLIHLRKTYFCRIIDLQDVDRTKAYWFFLRSRCRQWITPSSQIPHPYHRYQHLCTAHGWPQLSPIDIQNLAEPIRLPKAPYMLIVAGASNAHGGRKRWPQERYAEICNRLINVGVTPVLIGSKMDDLSQLEALCGGKVINLIGQTTLYQLITLATNAFGAIGNDTGPQLIIAASGCQTMTLFSGINPPEKGGAWPWDARHTYMHSDDLETLAVDDVWAVLNLNE